MIISDQLLTSPSEGAAARKLGVSDISIRFRAVLTPPDDLLLVSHQRCLFRAIQHHCQKSGTKGLALWLTVGRMLAAIKPFSKIVVSSNPVKCLPTPLLRATGSLQLVKQAVWSIMVDTAYMVPGGGFCEPRVTLHLPRLSGLNVSIESTTVEDISCLVSLAFMSREREISALPPQGLVDGNGVALLTQRAAHIVHQVASHMQFDSATSAAGYLAEALLRALSAMDKLESLMGVRVRLSQGLFCSGFASWRDSDQRDLHTGSVTNKTSDKTPSGEIDDHGADHHTTVRSRGGVFIALGSNVGDRLEAIEAACRAIDDDEDMQVIQTSSLYETEPMYVEDQARFLNGVCEVCE